MGITRRRTASHPRAYLFRGTLHFRPTQGNLVKIPTYACLWSFGRKSLGQVTPRKGKFRPKIEASPRSSGETSLLFTAFKQTPPTFFSLPVAFRPSSEWSERPQYHHRRPLPSAENNPRSSSRPGMPCAPAQTNTQDPTQGTEDTTRLLAGRG